MGWIVLAAPKKFELGDGMDESEVDIELFAVASQQVEQRICSQPALLKEIAELLQLIIPHKLQ